MVIKTVNLETVCGITSKFPVTKYPEFAFAGKSNVGKSTLINGLMNRKSYARTSSQPGKTQTVNYYNINDAFYLVDLPGYGYTTASVNVRQQWGEMVERYLRNNHSLTAVFLLVDIRHEPGKNDIMMFDWILQAGYTPYIVATKADKIKRSQLQKHVKMIREGLQKGSMVSDRVTFEVIPYSGLTKAGRETLYDVLDSFLEKEEVTAEE